MAVLIRDHATSCVSHWSISNASVKAGFFISCMTAVGIWRYYETSTHEQSFQQEIWIQWLSWAFIFGVLRVIEPSDKSNSQTLQVQSFWASNSAIWLTCATMGLSQLIPDQSKLTWTLPLTTIAVTLSTYFACTRSQEMMTIDTEKQATFSSPPAESLSDYHDLSERPGLSLQLILNAACLVLLMDYSNLNMNKMVIFHSFLFLVTRTTTIFCIARLQLPSGDLQNESSAPTLRKTLSKLSTHTLALLTVYLVIMRPELPVCSRTLLAHAIAQALWWLSFVTLARLQLVNTAANLDTIALSCQMALVTCDVQSLAMALLACLLSTMQSLFVLQPGPVVRRIVFSMSALFTLILWLHNDPRLSNIISISTFNREGQFLYGHPIETLVNEQRQQFSKVLARQSKTLDQAVKEYERRYGTEPPAGFDRWFEIAQDNDFVLVDEFDTFMQSIKPFHGIHPTIIQQRIDKALSSTELLDRVCVMHFKDNNVTYGTTEEATGRTLMDESWLEVIPYNMTVILNFFDEPMVSAPQDEVERAMHEFHQYLAEPIYKDKDQIHTADFLDIAKQNGWAATRSACSIESPSRASFCPERSLEAPLEFISNVTKSKDVCFNCEIKNEHGLLLNPGNLLMTPELSPLWSASKPSHFNDILYPSPYYINVRGDYDETLDITWDKKDNKFYWVGRSTGGYATEEHWDHFQRQRLVLKTSRDNNEQIQLLEEQLPNSNRYIPRHSTMGEISDLFEIRMADVLQCTDAACDIQDEVFGITPNSKLDPFEAAYSHKFVLDIDGNGFSGRYYRLLKSRSVVVKSTILKEWHDDFLFPWVHFVPLSIGYHELPEMARFLATTERGLQLSERIAQESSQWHDKVLRDVDLRIVWLRMLLEYGRMLNPEMTFKL